MSLRLAPNRERERSIPAGGFSSSSARACSSSCPRIGLQTPSKEPAGGSASQIDITPATCPPGLFLSERGPKSPHHERDRHPSIKEQQSRRLEQARQTRRRHLAIPGPPPANFLNGRQERNPNHPSQQPSQNTHAPSVPAAGKASKQTTTRPTHRPTAQPAIRESPGALTSIQISLSAKTERP